MNQTTKVEQKTLAGFQMLNHSNIVALFVFQAAVNMSSTRCSASGPIRNTLFRPVMVANPLLGPISVILKNSLKPAAEMHRYYLVLSNSYFSVYRLCADTQAKQQTKTQIDEDYSCALILS